jgi:hypothetical protein
VIESTPPFDHEPDTDSVEEVPDTVPEFVQFVGDTLRTLPDNPSTNPLFVKLAGCTKHDGPAVARSVPPFTTVVPLSSQFEPVSVKPGPSVSVPPLHSPT